MADNPNKEEYARSISFFLAELLRTRRVSLKRAAEIAQKILDNLNLVDTEQDFLRLIKQISIDFEELWQLQQIILQDIQNKSRTDMEKKVCSFIISILPTDSRQALDLLQRAAKDDAKLIDLTNNFPQFKDYLEGKV